MQLAGSRIHSSTLMPSTTLINKSLSSKPSQNLVFRLKEKSQLLDLTSSDTTVGILGLVNSGQHGLLLVLLLLRLFSRFPVKKLLGLQTTLNPTTIK